MPHSNGKTAGPIACFRAFFRACLECPLNVPARAPFDPMKTQPPDTARPAPDDRLSIVEIAKEIERLGELDPPIALTAPPPAPAHV